MLSLIFEGEVRLEIIFPTQRKISKPGFESKIFIKHANVLLVRISARPLSYIHNASGSNPELGTLTSVGKICSSSPWKLVFEIEI